MHLSHHIVKAMMEERHRGASRSANPDAKLVADLEGKRARPLGFAAFVRWAKSFASLGEVPAETFSHRLDPTRDLPALRGYPISGR
jgi:hypothetical protein